MVKKISIIFCFTFFFLRVAKADLQAPTLNSPDPNNTRSTSLNLDRAITIAIQSAGIIQKAKNDIDFSGAQLMQAYGQFLPSVGITATTTENLGTSYVTTTTPVLVQGSSYGATFQVSSVLNLFDGKANSSALKAALARKTAATLTLARAKQQIALDVTQSFLQIILDHQLVQVAEKNLNYSRLRQAQLQSQTRAGTKNKVDLFRQEAQTSADEYYLANSQNRERGHELLLLRKLKLEPDSTYAFIETPHERVDREQKYSRDESQLIRAALENREDLHASEHLVKAATWDSQGAKSFFLPRLDLNIGALSSGRIFQSQSVNGINVTPTSPDALVTQLGSQIGYSFGLSFTWNIFDRDLTKGNVARANVAISNARLDLDERRSLVVSEIRQAYGDIQTAKKQMESSRKGLLSAEQAFAMMQSRYDLGSANFIDLISAQTTLVQAQSLLAQSQINYDLQIQVLKTVLGPTHED